jgi:LacI family transcriptional regulator
LIGYLEALKQHGLSFQEGMLIKSNLDIAAEDAIALQMLRLKSFPDGLIVNDDHCAISCMNTLRMHGVRIPEDLKIAGSNNHPVSALCYPGLTSINIQALEMGQQAIAQLVNKIKSNAEKNSIPLRMSLEHDLIIRGSSVKTISTKLRNVVG